MAIFLNDLCSGPGSEFASAGSEFASRSASEFELRSSEFSRRTGSTTFGRGKGSRFGRRVGSRFARRAAKKSPALSPLNESESLALVEACLSRMPGAWEEFASRYRGHITTIARRTLYQIGFRRAEGVAQDVVGEVFAELLARDCKALRNFRAPFSLEGWLTVVTRRKTYRVAKRSRSAPCTLDQPENVAEDNGTSLASHFANKEEQGLLQQHVDGLPQRDRLLLQLFYKGGHSYKELAGILNIPHTHVGPLLARARQRLARAMGYERS